MGAIYLRPPPPHNAGATFSSDDLLCKDKQSPTGAPNLLGEHLENIQIFLAASDS